MDRGQGVGRINHYERGLTSTHSTSRLHMATVLTQDAMVPLERTVTLPHEEQTAVTHGIIRVSIDSTTPIKLPSPTSVDA